MALERKQWHNNECLKLCLRIIHWQIQEMDERNDTGQESHQQNTTDPQQQRSATKEEECSRGMEVVAMSEPGDRAGRLIANKGQKIQKVLGNKVILIIFVEGVNTELRPVSVREKPETDQLPGTSGSMQGTTELLLAVQRTDDSMNATGGHGPYSGVPYNISRRPVSSPTEVNKIFENCNGDFTLDKSMWHDKLNNPEFSEL